MRIVVFGSTGNAGQETVRQALARGFRVVAYARTPAKLAVEHDALTVTAGALDDSARLERAIAGADGVVSLLGPGFNARGTELSDGVRNIIAAMEKIGVRRLIQIATASAADPLDRRDLRFALMVSLIRRFVPGAYGEVVRIAEAVRASRLDWTLVRVPLLNENPLAGNVRVGYLGQKALGITISRADLAWFMLEQLQKSENVRKAPAVSSA